jgi:hypothetical protein
MRRTVLPLLIGSALGCSGGPTVDPSNLNGTYRATTFTVDIQGSQRRDVLAAGGSVNLIINPGQVTAGRLLIPVAAGVSPTEIDEQLTGRYVILGETLIRYESEPAGSFIDGFAFTVDPPELRAFLSLQPPQAGLISLILRKQ